MFTRNTRRIRIGEDEMATLMMNYLGWGIALVVFSVAVLIYRNAVEN